MRKRKPKARTIQGDPRYHDTLVARFINNLQWSGKRAGATTIFYDAMDIVKSKSGEEPELDIWKKALDNIMPHVEVRSRRIGGATFQIPTELPANRKIFFGMKWMIRYARERTGKGMAEKLAAEIIAAQKGEGAAVKKREDVHKMAEANRAFASFK
jgi:small subunit ribosomal protein S7